MNTWLPVDKPPAVAFLFPADMWPRVMETEMGAALWAERLEE